MINNISDFISLLTLIALTIISLGLFFYSFANKDDHKKEIISQLLKDYLDNEEE